MEYSFIFSQMFGLIGLVFAILRFTQKERKKLLLFAVPAGVNDILSMLLNHQYQGLSVGIASVISPFIQSLIHGNNKKTKIIRLMIGFLFGFIGFILYLPTNKIITWLPILGYINSRFTETLEDVQKMRKFWIISESLWGAYQFFCKNWIMVLGECIMIYINLKNLGFCLPIKKK